MQKTTRPHPQLAVFFDALVVMAVLALTAPALSAFLQSVEPGLKNYTLLIQSLLGFIAVIFYHSFFRPRYFLSPGEVLAGKHILETSLFWHNPYRLGRAPFFLAALGILYLWLPVLGRLEQGQKWETVVAVAFLYALQLLLLILAARGKRGATAVLMLLNLVWAGAELWALVLGFPGGSLTGLGLVGILVLMAGFLAHIFIFVLLTVFLIAEYYRRDKPGLLPAKDTGRRHPLAVIVMALLPVVLPVAIPAAGAVTAGFIITLVQIQKKQAEIYHDKGWRPKGFDIRAMGSDLFARLKTIDTGLCESAGLLFQDTLRSASGLVSEVGEVLVPGPAADEGVNE